MAADLGATVSQGQSVGFDEPVVLPETVNAIEVRQVSEENQGDKSSGITDDEEIGNAAREDYRKSVTKVIGMLEEMKQQMERLPDMSKPEHETLYNQLSSVDTSLKSIANELHFIREWMGNEIRKQPPPPPQVQHAGVVIHAVPYPAQQAGVVMHAARRPAPMVTDGENPDKKGKSMWRWFLGFK